MFEKGKRFVVFRDGAKGVFIMKTNALWGEYPEGGPGHGSLR